MNTTLFIAIIAVIIVVLALIFLRHDDSKSDYKEQPFKHSGKKWVFNGILDIDCPPADMTPFTDYEGEIQLMVKKGFVHYDLIVEDQKELDDKLGLFRGIACIEGGRIVIRQGNTTLGHLPAGLASLEEQIRKSANETEAYGYIASRKGEVFGEVCIRI